MTGFATRVCLKTALGGRRFAALALGVMLGSTAPSIVWAQMGGGPRTPSPMPSAAPDKPEPPSPDAVPGAKARAPAAPSTHAPLELAPTDALFDAINRGDIAGARDALNRGADMDGVNILGLTPMELSVDLGRNDISFMLLSMRGEDSGRGSRAVGRDTAGGPASAKTATPAKAAAAKSPSHVKAVAAAKGPAPAKPVQTPKLFANDGGTPLPSAGFLGFDSRSATN